LVCEFLFFGLFVFFAFGHKKAPISEVIEA